MITSDLSLAEQCLRRNDVIGFPTETVYGLAGNAFSAEAVQKIYDIKNRPADHPLIVHTGSFDQVHDLVKVFPDKARLLARECWPGPLTLLLEKHDRIPGRVTASSTRVAIRIPDHPIALELLGRLSFPLVAPSANPFTKVSPTRAEEVYAYFGETVPVILQGGACMRGIESTIVGFEQEEAVVYRLGAITVERIESWIGPVRVYAATGVPVVTPGNSVKHYAPETRLIIIRDVEQFLKAHPGSNLGIFSHSRMNPEELAPEFYSRLQQLDQQGYDMLLAEWFPDEGMGRTLNDRLRRSAVQILDN